jgi:type VI secretion system ImpA family protein
MTDPDSILTPITGPDPAGPDLRYEGVYDRIREFRREDDARATRGLWVTTLKVADWSAAAELCGEVLTSQSKDLQVACWLVDSVVARDGLAGLPPGFRLLASLCVAFWQTLRPRPQPDDEEDARQALFAWLDTRLAERVIQTPIAVVDGTAPIWQDHVAAQRAAAVSAPKPSRRPPSAVPEPMDMATIETAIERTSNDFYRQTAQDLASCVEAIAHLKQVLDGLCEGRGPSFSRLSAVIAAISAFLRPHLLRRGISMDTNVTPAIIVDTEVAPETPPLRDEDTPRARSTDMPSAREIASREDAYRALEAVAMFLERSEPHSPVPLLIRRAIVWGRMPLPLLLAEMMQDQPLTYRLLGLNADGTPNISHR